MPRTQPIGLRHGIRGGAIVVSATSSGGARPSHSASGPSPASVMTPSAKRQSPPAPASGTATAAAIVEPSTRPMA